MKTFVITLLFRCAALSAVSALYAFAVRKIGSIYSPKQRFVCYKILLAGFLVYVPSFGQKHLIEVSQNYADLNAAGTVESGLDVFSFLFLIWILGALIIIIKALVNHVVFSEKIKRAKPCENADIQNFVNTQSSFKKECRILLSDDFHSAMSIGVLRPAIILPSDFVCDRQGLLILAHELNHLKRKDTVFEFFEVICSAVYWFNPYIKVFLKNARLECEVSCDELTLSDKCAAQKEDYCHALLKSASTEAFKKGIACDFSPKAEKLKRRMSDALFSKGRKAFPIFSLTLAAFCVFSAAAVGVQKVQGFSQSNVTTTAIVDYSNADVSSQAYQAQDDSSNQDMTEATFQIYSTTVESKIF